MTWMGMPNAKLILCFGARGHLLWAAFCLSTKMLPRLLA
jgi:hypothetical protein